MDCGRQASERRLMHVLRLSQSHSAVLKGDISLQLSEFEKRNQTQGTGLAKARERAQLLP